MYLPTHQYVKYRLKDGRDKSGLDIIKEKPISSAQFAIINQMKREYEEEQRRLSYVSVLKTPSAISGVSETPKQITLDAFSRKSSKDRKATAVLNKLPASDVRGSKA